LDEPTNYLDVEHIEWLTNFLQNYEHAFILISHDIPFLNKVVNVIYHLEDCQLTRYSGNYDKFQELHAIYVAQQESAYERQQQEVAQLEDFIARNKARVATVGMARSRQKRWTKWTSLKSLKRNPSRSLILNLPAPPAVIWWKLRIWSSVTITPLTKPVTFKLERGQKIALKGVNGLGKTTLLKDFAQTNSRR
jgi:ATPase subunit of ABC transporter with duplicated ATPase domains